MYAASRRSRISGDLSTNISLAPSPILQASALGGSSPCDENAGAIQAAAPPSRTLPIHKGLESAKPDLQSLFKKPGGLARQEPRACARTSKWVTLRCLLMLVDEVGLGDVTRCRRATWPRERSALCWSRTRGLSMGRGCSLPSAERAGPADRAGANRQGKTCREAAYLCAEHVRQLGGASPLHNLMEVKC
jgi:hypothetical protein